MSDAPIPNPLLAESAAADEAHRMQVQLAAAQARSAEDWFDIFMSIVAHGVRDLTVKHGDAEMGERNLKDQRNYAATVRAAFKYNGLPLTEEMFIVGPTPVIDPETGIDVGVDWNGEQVVTFEWPSDKSSKLRFRGQEALIAYAFVRWWTGFQSTYQIMEGKAAEGEKRIIQPGSAEYIDYNKGRPTGA